MQEQTRIGQTLGNYRLVSLLGKGGYAEVYLAEQVHLGLKAAIKLLKIRNLDNLEQAKFLSEARILMSLSHPHIIKLLDYGIEMSQQDYDGSTPYLVMEYASHGTLRHLYPHGTRVPFAKIALYTKQIAEVLQYAHDNKVTHLDIKPENMLVRRADDVALSDFGIAVTGFNSGDLLKQQEEILKKVARREQIAIPGTAAYLAPERLQGYTRPRSDQYSLAVVVYEWLCGKRPFEGSDIEICQKLVKDSPSSLSKINPSVTPEIEQVVMRALTKDPEKRYKSVKEFAQELETAIQASLLVARPKPQPVSSDRQVPLPVNPVPQPVNPAHPPVNPAPAPTPRPAPPIMPPAVPLPPISPVSIPIPAFNAPAWQGHPQGQVSLPGMQPGQGYSDTTATDLTGASQIIKPPPREGFAGILDEISGIIDEPVTKTREMFVSDDYFVRTRRTRNFRLLGIPFNVLSALIVLASGPLPNSIVVATLGGIVSVWMLLRCTISVKKPIALTFGVGVSLWWVFVALRLAAHFSDQSLVFPFCFLVFAASLGIHIWYVNTRLKN